jgi:hypothetical protein
MTTALQPQAASDVVFMSRQPRAVQASVFEVMRVLALALRILNTGKHVFHITGGQIMATMNKCLVASGLLLLMGTAAQAGTLRVNCAGKGELNSIGAALKLLQNSEFREPATINVSGACRENLLIRDMDP